MPGPLLDTLQGANLARRPIWLMRQAGRYLPEYRELRAERGGFLALVYDTDAAAEVTVQPVRRFGFDGAILFSDILIVPYAMGQDLQFLAGEGPHLSPKLVDAALNSLTAVPERLAPIYETVAKVKAQLGPETTLLGFAGSPWTVATYMVAGEGSRDHHDTRAMAYRDPGAFQAIIDAITDVTIEYLSGQVEAGAEGLQLFDSWAGELPPAHYRAFALPYLRQICEALPGVPKTVFAKGAWFALEDIAELPCQVIGLDWNTTPVYAKKATKGTKVLQGNLDPCNLYADAATIRKETKAMLQAFGGRHIANLGHGVYPDTPLDGVRVFVDTVREGLRS